MFLHRNFQNPKFFSRYVSGVRALPSAHAFVCQGSYRPDFPVSFYRRVREHLSGKKPTCSGLFEVTREKEIVWECIVHMKGDLTHQVYQATRYPEAYVRPLLEKLERDPVDPDEAERLRSLPYTR